MSELPSFDNMLALHDENPQAFEDMRSQLLDEYIDSIPTPRRPRVEGLQFEIDARRNLANTPMAACLEMSNMMHETFWEMNCSLHNLPDIIEDPRKARLDRANKQTAQILAFKK